MNRFAVYRTGTALLLVWLSPLLPLRVLAADGLNGSRFLPGSATSSVSISSVPPSLTKQFGTVALGGRRNTVFGGPDPKSFTPDELQICQALKFSEVQLPSRRGLSYFHLDTFIDTQSSGEVAGNQLSVDVRVLCTDAANQSNVTKYTKNFDLSVKGWQHVGLGGVVGLDSIKSRNNGDEIPRNAYVAFRFHDKVFREVLLSDFGGDGWWRRDELASAHPTAPSAPAAIPTAPPPTPRPQIQSPITAEIVRRNHSNLVFVTMPAGAGSGFIAKYGTGTFLFTNAHVAAEAGGAVFRNLDGTQIQGGTPAVAVGHDAFLMTLKPEGTPLEIMMGVEQGVSIGDEVVVLGNAEGAGVINTIQGTIVGLGPDLVEIDAPFLPGNSGSPIIHLKSGKVIGVATYLTIRSYDKVTGQALREPLVRRFGYRLDSVKTWQPVNWQSFLNQAKEMESVETLTKDLVAFLNDLGINHQVTPGAHLNPAMKPHIDQWMAVVKAKHLSPHDADMADQNLLSYLKTTCQFDVTATQSHLTYDYFQRQLADQQRERAEISGYFTKIIESLGR